MEQTVTDQRGLVFDIQRDPSARRMRVYLKGCPLRCIWCRNPEGSSSKPEISFRAERCTECHSCAEICPEHVHHFDQPHSHVLERDFCNACAQCVSKCPAEALRRVGEWMQVEQALAGCDAQTLSGGLVLTGGEPMLQYPFARSLLAEAKRRGIPTCMETSGYAARARFEQLLPLVDVFYYDYKATNPNDHARLTGVSNRAILSNLDFLVHHAQRVVLRCPLVPGINDTPEHLAGIAALSRRYPRIECVEVIPYHDGGPEKANQVGRHPLLEDVQVPSEATKAAWIETLHDLNCEKARLY